MEIQDYEVQPALDGYLTMNLLSLIMTCNTNVWFSFLQYAIIFIPNPQLTVTFFR